MKMIKTEAKGFYFFESELNILKKIGFKFKHIEKIGAHRYKVLENPKPIKATEKRIDFIKNRLPFIMNAIHIFIEGKEI